MARNKADAAPTYMVYLGKEEQVRTEGRHLAMYAIKGFADGPTSRYDQVLDVVEKLAEEADCIDIRRMPAEEVEHLREVSWRPRTFPGAGLVAELVGELSDEGQWGSTYHAIPEARPPEIPAPQPFAGVRTVVN